MNRYFYRIEMNEHNNRVIHLMGNVFLNSSEDSDFCYRLAEWTFRFFEIDVAQFLINIGGFYEFTDERIDYISDTIKEKAEEICDGYFDGESGTELHISDIEEHTPCGDYYFDAE